MNDRHLPEDMPHDLEEALADFRGAVRHWSAQSEPHGAFRAPVRKPTPILRLAAAGALTAALVAFPVYEKVRHDRLREAQTAKEDAALLEQIDADLARSVPAPFEPLTQLVTFDTNRSAKETK